MTSAAVLSIEPLTRAQVGALYLIRLPSHAPLLGLHSVCWVAGRRYRVVGFLDLGEGQGPQVCVAPLDRAESDA